MSIVQPSPPPVPADVARDVSAWVRALVTAVRTQQMYGAQHPNALAAAERCRVAVAPLCAHEGLTLGVTPETLLVNGTPLLGDVRIREAAALLNEHDMLRLTFVSQPSQAELANFFVLLSFDGQVLRERGGPVGVWENYGHHWLQIEQIDYDSLLTEAPGGIPQGDSGTSWAAGDRAAVLVHDRVWQSLVRSLADGRGTLDYSAERRLMMIAKSADAIRAVTEEAVELLGDGHTQAQESAKAAAVLMSFQRLSDLVEAQAPAELDAVVTNIANAAKQMDPALLMRAVSEAAESGLGTNLIKALGERLDDDEVSNLLATSMAAEGKASGRMAAALNTLTPDDDRRGRVLRLAKARMRAEEQSPTTDVSSAWHALERFLDGPADEAYVSRSYGHTLEQLEARSARLRLDAPARLDEWVRTVSAESVRTLATTLLLDLFALEREPGAVLETAQDLSTLADDLLLAGDAVETSRIVDSLFAQVDSVDVERAPAARQALDAICRCAPLREMATLLGELDERQYQAFEQICSRLGVDAAEVLVGALGSRLSDATIRQLEQLIVGLGPDAADAVARRVSDPDPAVWRTVVRLLGRIGGTRSIAALHAVGRDGDADHSRAAIYELVAQNDPAAARVLALLLKDGPMAARVAAVDAVATSHHARAGALLARALTDLDPLGQDHELALRILAALRLVEGSSAIPAIDRVMHVRRWRSWRRTSRVRRLGASVLATMRVPEAQEALDRAVRTGDWQLRRIAAHARAAGG